MDLSDGYIWLAMLSVSGAGVIGALLYMWHYQRNLRIRQSIPENWPLSGRRLVSVEECQVWQWMCKTFPTYQVNLKIPVTRFTKPLERGHGEALYKMLGSVYCTFTVCTPDGYVVGCADVMGVNKLARQNLQIKQAVLARCGIAYCVIKPASLPRAEVIRKEFLGRHEAVAVAMPVSSAPPLKSRDERYQEPEEALLAEARLKLSMALVRRRSIRDSEFTPLAAASCHGNAAAHAGKNNFEQNIAGGNGLRPGWQRDSFLASLEP